MIQLVGRQIACCRRGGFMLSAAMLLWRGVSIAEPIAPARAREAAETIREAGYECREVRSIEVPTNAPPGSGSFGIQMVLCSNGYKFLIARSGRDRGSARPVVRQLN